MARAAAPVDKRRFFWWKRSAICCREKILTQRKRTFTLPWEEWLRGPLRARMEASFADPLRRRWRFISAREVSRRC